MAGLITRVRRYSLGIAAAVLLVLAFGIARPTPAARADCIFPTAPITYEGLKDRQLFLNTIDLAANNMLFPGDPYFGLPDLEFGPRNSRQKAPAKIPPTLLKSISWIESSITQAAVEVPFGSIGPALVSFDCGHGITQVTTGMTVPQGESGRASPEQALVATHFAYNIARGAVILANKWNDAPELRPIAGTDTNAVPNMLENWYYAIWVIQRLHRARRRPQQPPDGPDLRQPGPGRRTAARAPATARATTAPTTLIRSWFTAAPPTRRSWMASRCGQARP